MGIVPRVSLLHPPAIFEKQLAIAKESALYKQYGISIRENVRSLWGGHIDGFTFVDRMVDTIRNGFTDAWGTGMRAVGVYLGEITAEERSALENEISSELSHIYGFMNAIVSGSRLNGGKLSPLISRADMWVGRFVAVQSIAMSMAGSDKKLMWNVDITKEHCSTCLRLSSRVYRSSIWNKYDIYPRHKMLECGGWRCGCYFTTTSEPATPGRPPRIP